MDPQKPDSLLGCGDDRQATGLLISGSGFTLVELMVSLVVVLVVIAAASTAYVKLYGSFKVESRITETHMDTLCGMELLRYDVEMAGYGLPFDMNSITYAEAGSSPANIFNDAAAGVPRALVFRDNNGTNSSDILVIKSSAANYNSTTRKWSMMFKDGSHWVVKDWSRLNTGCNNETAGNFVNNERFIVIDDNPVRALQGSTGNWSRMFSCSYYTTNADSLFADATGLVAATTSNRLYFLYGIDPDSTPQMPFNRVDFYLDTSGSIPSRCFPGSAVLYRATINQTGGARNPQPLIDCVWDFQVAFGRDTNRDNAVEAWSSGLSLTAAQIREQVRELRIFILYHEGAIDNRYRFSGTLTLGDAQTGALKTFTPVAPSSIADPKTDPTRYRWKVAKLVVKPMNLEASRP